MQEIDLKDAKKHMRIDESYTGEDDIIGAYLAASLEACQKHIGKRFGDDLTMTPAIKIGCLMYATFLYENRQPLSTAEMTEIPMTISALWSVYRDVGIY